MEDLFQIIFILIFILTSIASSLSKKKKRQAKNTSGPPNIQKVPPMAKKKQKTSAELLEQMLGLKIELPEPPKREAPPVYSEETSDTWDPTREYESDYKKVDKLSNYEEKMIAKKSEFIEDKQKHRAFKQTGHVKPIRERKKSRASSLLEKQDSLKDLIIAQEILNKPKALRR